MPVTSKVGNTVSSLAWDVWSFNVGLISWIRKRAVRGLTIAQGLVSELSHLRQTPDITIHIHTRDLKKAGTDMMVYCVLNDKDGKSSGPLHLINKFQNDFEPGRTDVFRFYDLKDLGYIMRIELWTEGIINDDWFVETFTVENHSSGRTHIFPVHRWIPKNDKLVLNEFDSSLPQFDENIKQREKELIRKKEIYILAPRQPGMPPQCKDFPEEESFSDHYKLNITTRKLMLLAAGKFRMLGSDFKTIKDIEGLFKFSIAFPRPNTLDRDWKSDKFFGEQRVASCNSTQIRVCHHIPESFAVTGDMVAPFLEGTTLKDAMKQKRIFIIDHKILDGIKQTDYDKIICAPLALLYRRNDNSLVPIAIQLFQKPAPDNPVFLPSDNEWTWFLVKTWFNNADAAVHQSAVHLGMTHVVMESVDVSCNRQLSPSHPIYKLLAPHFLYIMAVNKLAMEDLVKPEGWVDESMTMGRLGLFDIVARRFTSWKIDVQGTLPNDLKDRGVLDPAVLPYYPYRDDALLLYNVIKKYARTIVEHLYDTPEKISEDNELQAWIKELSAPVSEGGCGFQGLPKVFTTSEEIVDWTTVVIYTCSVAHAAANFSQYDDYCFPPAYPPILNGKPPKDKRVRTEKDLIDCMPTRKQAVKIMVVAKILSERGTQPLGDFEVQFAYDPFSVEAVKQFREDLKHAEEKMKERNSKSSFHFDILYPSEVPNSISI